MYNFQFPRTQRHDMRKLTRSEDHSTQEKACSDLQQVSMFDWKESGYMTGKLMTREKAEWHWVLIDDDYVECRAP